MPFRLHIRPARKYAPPVSSRNRLLYAVLAVVVGLAGGVWGDESRRSAAPEPRPPGLWGDTPPRLYWPEA